MRSTVVTGSHGFIGLNLVSTLSQQFSSEETVIPIDVCDPINPLDLLSCVIPDFSVGIHLAAYPDVHGV